MDLLKNDRVLWVGLVLVFIVALLPRLGEPSSRYMLWYDRSLNFWEALREADLEETYQQYHPGVTTMWAAGLGIEAYRVANDLSADQIPPALVAGPQGAAARVGSKVVGLVIAICIAISYMILYKLSGWPVAITAGIFLAIDPYFIAQSRKIHVDAFLAMFMLVCALSWLSYLGLREKKFLILTGLFAGLALLTKSPSLFLAPFIVLTAIIDLVTGGEHKAGSKNKQDPDTRYRQMAIAVVTAGIIALLTVTLLWPALWVRPAGVVADYLSGIALETAQHETPQFLAGRITGVDPGPLLYPAFLAWKTTLAAFSGLILAIIFLFVRRGSVGSRTWWYMLLYIIGFLLIMTFGAQKKGRYILPAMLAIDVMAAWGVVEFARLIGSAKRLKDRKWVPLALVAGILLMQSIVIARHRPYFGTHHNLSLGGSRVAREMILLGNQGEGLREAADFLNTMHNAEELTVAVQDPDLLNFRSNFDGEVVHLWRTDPDFVLFYVNYIQRGGFDAQWLDLWDTCRKGDALWTSEFNGVTYVWICPAYPHKQDEVRYEQESDIRLGDHIRLLGYTVSSTRPAPGDIVTVTLYWQSDGQLPVDNHVFIHLIDDSNTLINQIDGVPVNGKRPTWTWRDSEIIADSYEIQIPETIEEGEYELFAGMYDFGTRERLPALNSNGQHLAGDRIPVGIYPIGE